MAGTMYAEREVGDHVVCLARMPLRGRKGEHAVLARVAPDGTVDVRKGWLAGGRDAEREAARLLADTVVGADGTLVPAALPKNVPGRPNPSWGRGDPADLRGALRDAPEGAAPRLRARLPFDVSSVLWELLPRTFNETVRRPGLARHLDAIASRHPWLFEGMNPEMLAGQAIEHHDRSVGHFFGGGGDVAAAWLVASDRYRARDDRHMGKTWTVERHVVRRLAGLTGRDRLASCEIRALGALPPDWVPDHRSDPGGWTAARILTRAADTPWCRTPADLRRLLAGASGDLEAFARRVAEAGLDAEARAGQTPARAFRVAVDQVDDFYHAFRFDILRPLTEIAGTARYDIEPEVARKLVGYGNLVDMADVARRWHAQERAIRAAINPADAREWPALAKPWRAPNGLDVVFLPNAAALDAEGARGPDGEGVEGMHHCIGGRASLCATGRSHVLSVRRSHGRSFTRVSTAEIEMRDGRPRVVEHQGRGNTEPGAEARIAVGAWRDAVACGRIALNPDALVERERPDRLLETPEALLRRAIPAWSGLLRRGYRNMDPTDLAFAALDILEVAPQGARRRFPAPGRMAP